MNRSMDKVEVEGGKQRTVIGYFFGLKRRYCFIVISVCLVLTFYACWIHNASRQPNKFIFKDDHQSGISPTFTVVTVDRQDGRKHQEPKRKKFTQNIRSGHRKRLLTEINTLMKKPPMKWKDYLTHKIMPLQKAAPCFCPPCGKINQSKRSCDDVRSQRLDNLSDVMNSADRLNLRSPFQQVPSSSNVISGAWKPSQCQSGQKMAIIIPFRNRWRQLNTLLEVLHPFLQRQNLCYRIFVIEQHGNAPFNKGRVNNAGFLEAAKRFRFDCVIFHDTDFVPFSDRNRYRCPGTKPIHMVTGMNDTNFKLPYYTMLGGLLAFSVEHFVRLNGFSNLYWGWGLEDDDIEIRMKMGPMFGYLRPKTDEGYFRIQKHTRQDLFPIQRSRRAPLLSTVIRRYLFDGLSSVKYKVIRERLERAYTHMLVFIGKEPADFVV